MTMTRIRRKHQYAHNKPEPPTRGASIWADERRTPADTLDMRMDAYSVAPDSKTPADMEESVRTPRNDEYRPPNEQSVPGVDTVREAH